MNFYQAPIARRVALATKTETDYIGPLAPASGVFGTPVGYGLNVTVFLETPGWPTAASKINVRGHVVSGTGNCVVAPNVCLSDADSYLFLRGNNVYANNATAGSGAHIVYCAQLDVNSVASARATAENDYWVRPGDTITFTNPFTGTVGSNLGSDGTRSTAVITSVRHKSGSKSLLIEFTVPIAASTAVKAYAGGSSVTSWMGRDLVFFAGSNAANATDSKGLSYHRLTLNVTGPSDVWTGTLSNAINLTYTAANRPGLIPVGTAPLSADMVDPSKMLVCNSASLAANGRLHMGLTGTAAYHNDYAFEHISDFNQGSVPYRCISFSASAGPWVLEILAHPLH